jgi:hypothetical protein
MNRTHFNYLKRKTFYRIQQKLNRVDSVESIPDKSTILLVSTKHELSETMLYPFYIYHKELKQHGHRFSEVRVENLTPSQVKKTNINRIYFQAGFEMKPEIVVEKLKLLKAQCPNAQIAYMDWYAPLHVRPAAYVNEFIDRYIKKQTYRDFKQYKLPTIRDTNLSDFYSKRHDIDDKVQIFLPPADLEQKITLWSNFGYSPQMMDLFLGKVDCNWKKRPIDLHARLAVRGDAWYQAMRQEAKDAVDHLPTQLNIAKTGRVRRYQFFQEMTQSKMCFSPFGYGEICWRDYEAFATGSLLLKPNMDHLIVEPDIFIPNETYVSLNWDLSDLEEKIEYYLMHPEEAEAIAENAFNQMQNYIQSRKPYDMIVKTI